MQKAHGQNVQHGRGVRVATCDDARKTGGKDRSSGEVRLRSRATLGTLRTTVAMRFAAIAVSSALTVSGAYAQNILTDAVDVATASIQCPTKPIRSGQTIHGFLDQHFPCPVTVPINLQAVPRTVKTIADVYSFTAVAGSRVWASATADNSAFGFPYLAILDASGNVRMFVVGTHPGAPSGFEAIIDYTVSTSSEWQLLVTGVGFTGTTAVTDYQLTFTLAGPPPPAPIPKRHAARH